MIWCADKKCQRTTYQIILSGIFVVVWYYFLHLNFHGILPGCSGIPTWFGILSGSSRTKKCLFYILCCSGHFLARFFWVLGVGRPVSLKNPNNPFLGWLKTLSNDDNDLRYSPPAWRRGSAKSSKTRGHVAHSGVSEQGPLCLFTFLTFCLSAFLT